MTKYTHFATFWRELDARLSDEFETPARFFEAAPRYSADYDMDAIVESILRSRVIAAQFNAMFAHLQAAA
jgi:hypothetical protein